jgi:hypothetical protein
MPEDTPKNDLVLPEKKKRGRPRKNPDVTASAAKEKPVPKEKSADKDVADDKVEKAVEAKEKVKKSSVKKANKVRENEIAKNNDS